MKKSIIGFLVLGLLVGCQSTSKDEVADHLEEVKANEIEVVEVSASDEVEVEDVIDLDEVELNVLFELNELAYEYIQPMTYLGRLGAYDLYYTTPHILENKGLLYQTNASTFEVIREVELEEKPSKIKMIDHQLVVMMSEAVYLLDETLEQVGQIELPMIVTEGDDLFGIDFTDDLSTIVYSNLEGLWILNGEEEPYLLAEPIYYEDNKLLEVSYYGMPTFVNGEQSILVEIGGYEAAAGYLICEVDSKTCERLQIGAQAMLEDLSFNQDYLKMMVYGESDWETRWFDLTNMAFLERELIEFETVPGQIREIRDYVQLGNELYLAIAIKNEGQFLPKWFDLERYEIQADGTLEFIEQLGMIEEINVDIIGVTAEGKIVYCLENYDLGYSTLQLYLTE